MLLIYIAYSIISFLSIFFFLIYYRNSVAFFGAFLDNFIEWGVVNMCNIYAYLIELSRKVQKKNRNRKKRQRAFDILCKPFTLKKLEKEIIEYTM